MPRFGALWRVALLILGLAVLGPVDADSARAADLAALRSAYEAYGTADYEAAEAGFRRYLATWEEEGRPKSEDAIYALGSLAKLLTAVGRTDEAAALFAQAIDQGKKAFGARHLAVIQARTDFAALLFNGGLLDQAETQLEAARDAQDRMLRDDDPLRADALNLMAKIRTEQGDYDAAEKLLRRALAMQRKHLPPEDIAPSTTLFNLARLHALRGDYRSAESELNEVVALREESLGPNHPLVGQALFASGDNLTDRGLYDDAIMAHRRALTIWETHLGLNHPNVAASLNNLAVNMSQQGALDEAAALQQRALNVIEAAQGRDHAAYAGTLNNLAWITERLGRGQEAERLQREALEIRRRVLPAGHPDIAGSLVNLGRVLTASGRLEAARPLLSEARDIRLARFGEAHPDFAAALLEQAELERTAGNSATAGKFFDSAIGIYRETLGGRHPRLAGALSGKAGLLAAAGQPDLALATIREASAIHQQRAGRAETEPGSGHGPRRVFEQHLELVRAASLPEADRLAESFRIGQAAHATSVGLAVARMAARFAAGSGDLAMQVRQHQDTVNLLHALNKRLVTALASDPNQRDQAAEAVLRAERIRLERELEALEDRLATDFPSYAELTAPRPLAMAELRRHLARDEALFLYLVTDQGTYIWLVSQQGDALHFDETLTGQRLQEAVSSLRAGVDLEGMELRGWRDLPAFDFALSADLYRRLIGWAEPRLDGVKELLIVPDGALQSLPFSLFLRSIEGVSATQLSDYGKADWLVRHYATTTLPSASSLTALRQVAGRSNAGQPFLGIGDPILGGGEGATRGIGLSDIYGGGIADVRGLRLLPPLPETADELRSMATWLEAGPDSLMLAQEAREALVKQADLADHRVLAFATHGLVAGALEGTQEPALVLTPPQTPDARDDGLLTASEIAELRFDADLVILSACNTAADDGTPGAEGFSGLTKAFLYAGSRSLMVSHWPVISDATVTLTTATMAEMIQNPAAGRARALQQAMLGLIADSRRPHYAHPLLWAPFVLVGDSGRRRP